MKYHALGLGSLPLTSGYHFPLDDSSLFTLHGATGVPFLSELPSRSTCVLSFHCWE